MHTLGNILWFILGGFIAAILYFVAGLVFCITIIGIPFGCQLFKFAGLCLWPFGTEVYNKADNMGCVSLAMNIIWIILGWWEIAAFHAILGMVFCITIVGIPFGVEHFKIAGLSIAPFGRGFRKEVE